MKTLTEQLIKIIQEHTDNIALPSLLEKRLIQAVREYNKEVVGEDEDCIEECNFIQDRKMNCNCEAWDKNKIKTKYRQKQEELL